MTTLLQEAISQSHCGPHMYWVNSQKHLDTWAIQRLDTAVDRNHPAERFPPGSLSLFYCSESVPAWALSPQDLNLLVYNRPVKDIAPHGSYVNTTMPPYYVLHWWNIPSGDDLESDQSCLYQIAHSVGDWATKCFKVAGVFLLQASKAGIIGAWYTWIHVEGLFSYLVRLYSTFPTMLSGLYFFPFPLDVRRALW